jgi:hypothetical protein
MNKFRIQYCENFMKIHDNNFENMGEVKGSLQ